MRVEFINNTSDRTITMTDEERKGLLKAIDKHFTESQWKTMHENERRIINAFREMLRAE